MALTRITDVHEEAKSWPVYDNRYRFGPGASQTAPRTSPWLSEKQYHEAEKLQSSTPVCVGTILSGRHMWRNVPVRGRALWWYKDQFYVQEQQRRLAGATGETVDGLKRLAGVTVRCEELPSAAEPKKSVPWWTKITGAREQSSEDSLAYGERRYFFAIGASKRAAPRTPSISEAEYQGAKTLQSAFPVPVGTIVSGRTNWRRIPVRDKQLWWYKDQFYLEEGHALSQGTSADTAGWTKIPGVHVQSEEDSVSHYEERYSFAIGRGRRAPVTWPPVPKKEYARAKHPKSPEPVCVGTIPHGAHAGKSLWCYKDEFYVERDNYSSEQVQLLLWERERKSKRKFDRLRKEMLSDHAIEQARRERIPEDVRIFVWKRDEGRCVQCGSQENLEFDHIVPVSRGGSNTARNIQLLCETCNRRKSDRI